MLDFGQRGFRGGGSGGSGGGGFVDTIWKVVDTLQKLAMLVVFAVIVWFVWSILSWLRVVKSMAEVFPSVFGWTQWLPDFAQFLFPSADTGGGVGDGQTTPVGGKPTPVTPIYKKPAAAVAYVYHVLIILLSIALLYFIVFWMILPFFRGGNYSIAEYMDWGFFDVRYAHTREVAKATRALDEAEDKAARDQTEAEAKEEAEGVVVDMVPGVNPGVNPVAVRQAAKVAEAAQMVVYKDPGGRGLPDDTEMEVEERRRHRNVANTEGCQEGVRCIQSMDGRAGTEGGRPGRG